MNNYLNVDYTGQIFQYSKDPKEGYVEHKTSSGKVSYRKYYNKGVEGALLWINSKVNPNLKNRQEIEVVLGSGEDRYYLNFPLYSGDGLDLEKYSEQLVRYLPLMEKGVVYSINNWYIKKGEVVNGNTAERDVKGLTIKVAGEKITPKLTYQTDANPNGDIPKLEWREKGGKQTISAVSREKKTDYLVDVLTSELERLKFESNNSNQQSPQQSYTNNNNTQENNHPVNNYNDFDSMEEDDDLPF